MIRQIGTFTLAALLVCQSVLFAQESTTEKETATVPCCGGTATSSNEGLPDNPGRKQRILALYASVIATEPTVDGVKTCWAISDGKCGPDGYSYRCCCNLTPLGCSSDWIERSKCVNGLPSGSWEKVPNTDCTTLLVSMFRFGCERVATSNGETFIPITKEKRMQLIRNRHGVAPNQVVDYCHMVGTPPYAFCSGDCSGEFQLCLLENYGEFFYCTCRALVSESSK